MGPKDLVISKGQPNAVDSQGLPWVGFPPRFDVLNALVPGELTHNPRASLRNPYDAAICLMGKVRGR